MPCRPRARLTTRSEPVAAIPTIVELNIGHFLIGEAIFTGLETAIRRMRALMDRARARARGERPAGMILGIGSDLIDIRRIEKTLERFGERFLDRIFTARRTRRAERRAGTARGRASTYAKRFAAKEACSKALGTGFRRACSGAISASSICRRASRP